MARKKIWKDALYAGTWVTTKGQVFHCGPTDLQHFCDRTKAMLSNGAAIPWTWEHATDADATSLSSSDLHARWAKNTGGHLHDVRISPNGPLEILMDVDETSPDKDGKTDRQKLESIKFVSPDIRHNWRDRHGPASDATGPYWPGQSFAHIAITPMPVQYPQSPFNFAEAVSLSAAAVDVSLSSAVLKTDKPEKGKDMPFPPKKDDDDAPPDADMDGIPDGDPAEDLDLAPPPPPADDGVVGDTAAEAAAMAELEHELGELGIEFHGSASDSVLNFIQHLNSCIKTHKATKAGGIDKPDPNQPDPNQPNPQEPETSEMAPIMMSATTATPTARETKLEAKLLKLSKTGLVQRIAVLQTRGYIDADIKRELETELGTVKLSMTDDGDLEASSVLYKVSILERVMKTGKPGPFAPAKKPEPAANPLKPISSAIALSATQEEEVVSPEGADDEANHRKAQEQAGDDLANRCMTEK